MKPPFNWDNYSDQPAQLQDRAYKQMMRKRQLPSLLKTFGIALVMLPFSLIAMPFVKRKVIKQKDFFSMGVDFEREPETALELIEEIGVKNILLRFKLWEMQNLEVLASFIEKCKNKNITLKILQDRENIEDLELLKKNLETIFTKLDGCLLYTSPSPRDISGSRMPSSA